MANGNHLNLFVKAFIILLSIYLDKLNTVLEYFIELLKTS